MLVIQTADGRIQGLYKADEEKFPSSNELQGVCMENRACVGVAKFNSASLNQPKLEQMKALLRTNCGILLEGVIAEEAQFRSIALQVRSPSMSSLSIQFRCRFNGWSSTSTLISCWITASLNRALHNVSIIHRNPPNPPSLCSARLECPSAALTHRAAQGSVRPLLSSSLPESGQALRRCTRQLGH